MAKLFYSAEEAANLLGVDEVGLTALVREGKLREFRDAGSVNYKVGDVDKLAPAAVADAAVLEPASASASGEVLLEPADESGLDLSGSLGDVISLEESDAAATALGGSTAVEKAKEDSVVPSVGVNVFDDDELDEQVDPLAQTAVTDLAGLGLDGTGGGSGILDLTREPDDTSLGRELLDEIYTDDDESAASSVVSVGEGTRAAMDAAGEEVTELSGEEIGTEVAPAAAPERAASVEVAQVAVYGPDPVSSGLTAMMFVAVIVMWFGGLAAASLVRGVYPGLLRPVYANLWMFAAGAVGLAGVVGAAAFFLARKRG